MGEWGVSVNEREVDDGEVGGVCRATYIPVLVCVSRAPAQRYGRGQQQPLYTQREVKRDRERS
jgi:hypothetical protein